MRHALAFQPFDFRHPRAQPLFDVARGRGYRSRRFTMGAKNLIVQKQPAQRLRVFVNEAQNLVFVAIIRPVKLTGFHAAFSNGGVDSNIQAK